MKRVQPLNILHARGQGALGERHASPIYCWRFLICAYRCSKGLFRLHQTGHSLECLRASTVLKGSITFICSQNFDALPLRLKVKLMNCFLARDVLTAFHLVLNVEKQLISGCFTVTFMSAAALACLCCWHCLLGCVIRNQFGECGLHCQTGIRFAQVRERRT
jgi:hypothetical protein